MGKYLEDRVFAQTDRTETAKLMRGTAVTPEVEGYADALRRSYRDLAAALVNAYQAPTGWRVPRNGANEEIVAELRSMGLVEVTGAEPTPEAIAKGRGYHLSAFALRVRRCLMENVK